MLIQHHAATGKIGWAPLRFETRATAAHNVGGGGRLCETFAPGLEEFMMRVRLQFACLPHKCAQLLLYEVLLLRPPTDERLAQAERAQAPVLVESFLFYHEVAQTISTPRYETSARTCARLKSIKQTYFEKTRVNVEFLQVSRHVTPATYTSTKKGHLSTGEGVCPATHS